MKIKISSALILLALFLVTSCSQDKPKIVDLNLNYVTSKSVPVKTTDLNAQSQLAEAAVSASSSLNEISEIQVASTPKGKLSPPLNPQAIGMAQLASLNWNGPVEPLLKRLAAATHYQLKTLGEPPVIPALVNINAEDVTLADILRDITFQIEKKASITVYPERKLIELRYYVS